MSLLSCCYPAQEDVEIKGKIMLLGRPRLYAVCHAMRAVISKPETLLCECVRVWYVLIGDLPETGPPKQKYMCVRMSKSNSIVIRSTPHWSYWHTLPCPPIHLRIIIDGIESQSVYVSRRHAEVVSEGLSLWTILYGGLICASISAR